MRAGVGVENEETEIESVEFLGEGVGLVEFGAGLAGQAEHEVADDADAGFVRPAEDVAEALVGHGPMHDFPADAFAAAFDAVGDLVATGFGKHMEHGFADGFDASVEAEAFGELLLVEPAELLHPGVMDGERIVEEDDIGEIAGGFEAAEFVEDVLMRTATAVFARAFIEFVEHAGTAVGAREGAAALSGNLHDPMRFVEDIARGEGEAVDGFDRRTEDGLEAAADPDVAEAMGRPPGGESFDEFEEGLFAFAEGGEIEARGGEDALRRERGMEPPGDDGYVEFGADDADEVARTKPLAGGHGNADQAGRGLADEADDFGVRHFDKRADHHCFVAVVAEVGGQEGRAEGGHGPLAFGVHFEKDNAHGMLWRLGYHAGGRELLTICSMKLQQLLLALLAAVCLTVAPTFAQGAAKKTPAADTKKEMKAAAPAAAGLIDINSADASTLKTIPGIGDAYSAKIIANRPYKGKDEIVKKAGVPQGVYDKIKDKIIAKQK